MEFVGRAVTKEFKGYGIFEGTVESYDSSSGFFRILYEDGDSEEVDLAEVSFLVNQSVSGGKKKKPGRKPKKRRRIGVNSGKGFDDLVVNSAKRSQISEIDGGAGSKLGNLSEIVSVDGEGKMLDLNLDDDGLNSNDVVDVKVESLENGGVRGFIDLNLAVDHEVVDRSKGDDEGEKVERGFDLNVGFSDEGLVVGSEGEARLRDAEGCMEGVNGFGSVSCNGTSAESVSTEHADAEDCVNLWEEPKPMVVDANNGNDSSCGIELKESSSVGICESPCEEENSRRKKRRKPEVDDTVSPSATVLRRSARKTRATAAEVNNSCKLFSDGSNDMSSSAVSVVTEDKPSVAECEEVEASEALPPVVELPPSSTNLNLDGLSVSDVFSVYACLRSFTTTLYLSPFELEDLVAALKSNSANSLLDFIHVSILQALRKHLEFLSSEGSESASKSLRNLNWDLLDIITWPMFLVEYLLIHGSRLQDGLDLASLTLFESDYYKQPAEVKIKVLVSLCDDVMEVDSIRSELNRRSMLAGSGVDFDRNMNNDVICKKRAYRRAVADSCIGEDVDDNTTDWNSDECCLCKMDGSLICCDGCPAAYHARCVGVACNLLPEGEWYCPECSTGQSSGTEPQKLIRGAEPLGVDPYGRLYFSSYGYLLVSDSCDAESAFSYYNRNDLSLVIDILQSSASVFGSVLCAISELQALHACSDLEKGSFDSVNLTSNISSLVADPVKTSVSSNDLVPKDEAIDAKTLEEDTVVIDSAIAEVSVEEAADHEELAEVLQGSPPAARRGQKKSRFAGHIHKTSVVESKEEPASQMQFQNKYMNNYDFARTASSVVEELTRKSSDKPNTEEEIISVQLKVIVKKWSKFFWLGSPRLDAESLNEKCGWCYTCRFPAEDRDCLFNTRRADFVSETSKTEIAGLQSHRSRKGHLVDVICYVLSLEDRLRGILLGPWLSLHYSNLWRENVLEASNVASVKYCLLMLEKNLRPQALSAEWSKHVDSAVTMGSASHTVINSRAASRLGLSRKRLGGTDSGPISRNGSSGLDLFWWRGGRLSRKLFNWKVLPRSVAAKAARQGGCVKIPGILYPDGSEFAKRSKHIVWRAAVETSTGVEQLALQVRELDQNIRWDDVENTHLLPLLDNESKKSIRLFKKVVVRRKTVEGTTVRYLLDFGKRRSIPDVVVRHGKMLEDPGERKKYWLEESYLPLYLLKGFEEKRIARKASKMNSNRASKNKFLKKPFRRKGLEYLVSRAEAEEKYQCGHCKKDVPIRDAVSCRHCSGFFHVTHARKLSGTNAAKFSYACHRCLAAKSVTIRKRGRKKKKKLQIGQEGKMASVGKRGRKKLVQMSRNGTTYFGKKRGRKPKPKKGQKTSSSSKQVLVGNNKVPKVNEKTPHSNKSADVSPSLTLRRSCRIVRTVPGQYAELEEDKNERQSKYRSASSKKPHDVKSWKRKRTPILPSFWINGLKFSRKPNDELAAHFKRTKLLPSESSTTRINLPECPLCCMENRSPASKLLSCDTCGGWFHGHAFGLDPQNVEHLIGFRCHLCLQRDPPSRPCVEDSKSSSILSDVAAGRAEAEVGDRMPSKEAAVPVVTYGRRKFFLHNGKRNLVWSTSEKAYSVDHQASMQKLKLPVETGKTEAAKKLSKETVIPVKTDKTEAADIFSEETVIPVETDNVQKSVADDEVQNPVQSTSDEASSQDDQTPVPELELHLEFGNLNACKIEVAEKLSGKNVDFVGTDNIQKSVPDNDMQDLLHSTSENIQNPITELELPSKSGILNACETEVAEKLSEETVDCVENEVASDKEFSDNDMQNLVQSTSEDIQNPVYKPELPVETGNLAACETLSEEAVVPMIIDDVQNSGPIEDLQVPLQDPVETEVAETLPEVVHVETDDTLLTIPDNDVQVSLQNPVETKATETLPEEVVHMETDDTLLTISDKDVQVSLHDTVESKVAQTLAEEGVHMETDEALLSIPDKDLRVSLQDLVESAREVSSSNFDQIPSQQLQLPVEAEGPQTLLEEANGSHLKPDIEASTRGSVESISDKPCLGDDPTVKQKLELLEAGKEENNSRSVCLFNDSVKNCAAVEKL